MFRRRIRYAYVVNYGGDMVDVYSSMTGLTRDYKIPYNTIRYNMQKNTPYKFIRQDKIYTIYKGNLKK